MEKRRKITINDIAKEAGVSRSLVSSVLTNIQKGEKIYRVSEETTMKILQIIDKYDFRPSYSARALRSGNNHTIGVILSDISNRFFSVVSRNIVNCAQKQGYMVMFGNTDEKPENLSENIETFRSKGVQGFIVVPCVGAEDTIMHYKEQGVPIVLLDRDFKNSGLSSVTLDNRKASVQLTDRLISEGYRKIELVSYSTELGIIKDRENAYIDRMKECGHEVHTKVHRPQYCNFEEVENLILDATARGVEALVFTTYRMALLGRRATLRHNISSPCAFACFNNADTFDIYEKGMYYVKQPIEQFAENAVSLIIRELEENGEKEYTKIILEPQIETTEY